MTTRETVGNQFGYLCPKCKQGDSLSVTFIGTCELVPDGTEDAGNHEWDDESAASCGCGWGGTVKDFEQAEDFEEE